MPSTKSIKQRIKSVQNTAQITRAMEVVSATKMRKSQEFALRARLYAIASLEMLNNLLTRTPKLPLLLCKREIRNSFLLVVTSDKGLAGAFNSNVIKKAENWIAEKKASGKNYTLITIGKKAKDYFERRKVVLRKSYIYFSDFSTLQETLPVANIILQGFINNEWDEVDAIYTNFRTTLKQETVQKKILPVSQEGIKETVEGIVPEKGRYAEVAVQKKESTIFQYEYKFEPSAQEILDMLIPQLLRMHIHHIILESNASEHSARMVAMKNASDNATELIDDLTLIFNKARQANITRELIEITAGKVALEK